MTTTSPLPTQGALIARFGQLSNRDVLSVTEVTSTVRILIVPLLQHIGHDTTVLSAAIDEDDIVTAKTELGRFIQREARTLIDRMAIADADHRATCESLICCAAGVKLMRLLAEMPTHQGDTTA